jgi:hypothetical protein
MAPVEAVGDGGEAGRLEPVREDAVLGFILEAGLVIVGDVFLMFFLLGVLLSLWADVLVVDVLFLFNVSRLYLCVKLLPLLLLVPQA